MEANEAGNEVNEETQPIDQTVPDQPTVPVGLTPSMDEPIRMAEPLPIRIGSTIDIPQRRSIREEEQRMRTFRAMQEQGEFNPARATAAAISEQASQIREQMMASTAVGMRYAPEKIAEAKPYADELGVSARLAAERIAELRKSVQMRQIDRLDLPVTAPILAREMANPDFAAVAHDDLENLAKVESSFSWIGRQWDNWVNSVASGIIQTQQAMDYKRWQETGKGAAADPVLLETIRGYSKALETDLRYDDNFLGAVGTLAGQQLENVPEAVSTGLYTGTAGALAGLAGGPAGFATVPGGFVTGFEYGFKSKMLYSTYEQETGGAYAEIMRMTAEAKARRRFEEHPEQFPNGFTFDPFDGDHLVASRIATGVGALNMGIESALMPLTWGAARGAARKYILGEVSKQINKELLIKPTVRKAIYTVGKNALKSTAGETGQEVLQEMVSILGEHVAMRLHDPNAMTDFDTNEGRWRIATRIKDIAVQTAMGMSVLGLGGPSAELHAHMRNLAESNRGQRFFNDLEQGVKKTEMLKRSRNVLERILAKNADGTGAETVFINANELRDVLAKNDLTPEALDEIVPGIAAQLGVATGVDDDVKIPTSVWAAKIVGTQFESLVRPLIRINENDLSLNDMRAEAKKSAQRLIDAQERLDSALASNDEKFSEEVKAIHNEVAAQDEQAGRPKEEAQLHALLLSEMIATMAAEDKRSPAELWAEYKLSIAGQEGQQAAAIASPVQAAAPVQPVAALSETDTKPLQRALDSLSARISEHNVRVVNEGRDNTHPEYKAGQALNQAVRDLQETIDNLDEQGIANELAKLRDVLKENRGNIDGNTGKAADALLSKASDLLRARQQQQMSQGQTGQLNQALSTRLPSAVKATEDPLMSMLSIDYGVTTSDPDTLAKNMSALNKTPNVRKLTGPGSRNPVTQAEAFIQHVVDNLLFLHDAMDPEWRDRAKLWYDGGRKLAEAWSAKYGISPMQAAAMIAVLSPQNDWYQNVSQAERILDAISAMRDFVWDDAMTAEAARIQKVDKEGKPIVDPKMEEAKGKTLGEVLAMPDVAARWIRIYDQTHNDRTYRVLTPEGGAAGLVQTKDGADSTMMWKTYTAIAKAISIMQDGRAENVYVQLGNEHKVRNFYNNLFDPKSETPFVTIDTHAVAAALLRPLSGNDVEVAQAFGSQGAASSSFTGLNGTYPLFAEAYKRAAQARGLQAREMQSITWEAVRGLFEASKKSGMKEAANKIWERYKAGEITQQDAQKEIMELAQGITAPSWTTVPFDSTVSRTYTGEGATAADAMPAPAPRQSAAPSQIMVEVAPDPADKGMVSRWAALPPQERVRITHQIVKNLVPKVLAEVGTSGQVQSILGGYEGSTNPSVILSIDNKQLLATVAKMMGFALSQAGVVAVSNERVLGTSERGAISITLPEGYTAADVTALYERLWELKDNQGNRLVGGHTTNDGYMTILNYSGLDTAALAAMIDKHLDGEFTVDSTDVFAADLNKKDYDYDAPTAQQPIAGRPSSTQRIRGIRDEARSELRREIDRTLTGNGERRGRNPDGTLAPLPGAPDVRGATGPDAGLNSVAEQYARANGIPFRRQATFAYADEKRGKRIADAFAAMKHNPADPVVKEAYENLIRQTIAQYRALEAAGYKFWLFDGDTDPYDTKPWRAMQDLRANKSMGVFSTLAGFGSGDTALDVSNNPLLADTGIMWPMGSPDGPLRPVLANDLFRAVHDAFGHGLEGAGFRAEGEENAWQAHVRLFTGSAVGAMTSETRGQNSWLNFGPHGAANRTAGTLETTFADQKIGLMPEWTWQEGVVADEAMPTNESEALKQSFVPPGFYSALRDEVAGIDAKAMTADGWNQRIKGLIAKGAIKEQEVFWSGVMDFLSGQEGKITKDQVIGFLNGNGVRVERIDRVRRPSDAVRKQQLETAIAADVDLQAKVEILRKAGYTLDVQHKYLRFVDETGKPSRHLDLSYIIEDKYGVDTDATNEIMFAADDINDAFKGLPERRPKYATWNEDGGQNYREMQFVVSPESFPGRMKLRDIDNRIVKIEKQIEVINEPFVREQEPFRVQIRITESEVRTARAQKERVVGAALVGRINNAEMAEQLAPINREIEALEDKIEAISKQILQIELRKLNANSQLLQEMANLNEARDRQKEQIDLEGGNPEFFGTHWDEANVVVHTRMDDRSDADGKNFLRIAEFQSDWAQKGTAEGFVGQKEEDERKYQSLMNERVKLEQQREGVAIELLSVGSDEIAKAEILNRSATLDKKIETLDKQIKRLNNRINQDIYEYDVGPFVTTTDAWLNLALKQMLIDAVNGPYEYIVIANAENQITRYPGMDEDQKAGHREFYGKMVPIAVAKLMKRFGDVQVERKDVGDLKDQLVIQITPEMRMQVQEGMPLFQRKQEAARGTFDPRTMAMRVMNAADASTLLHESAHYYLTVLGKMAASPGASERTLANMDTILQWFGIEGATRAERIAKWNSMSLEEQRPHHEAWAYNHEIYVAEGKAPTLALESVFAKYSQMLKQVYRVIRDELNALYRREHGRDLPMLTPEIRQVMDRLLATDDQIEHAEAVRNMTPTFQTQEESGMNDAQWAAYQQMAQDARDAAVTDLNKASMRQMQWLSNAQTRVLKAMQAKHDEVRKEIRAEVTAEVRRRPVHRAMLFMRSGILLNDDGTETKVDAIKMSREAVQRMYSLTPPELRPNLLRLSRFTTDENGLHPDILAELFGFSSGDSMINAILNTPSMKDEITARTDERMMAEHGDMNTPEARKAAIEQALHGEARARMVAVELRFLAKAVEPVRVMVDAAKRAAKQMIDSKVIRDLRPSEYSKSEAKASRLASTAANVRIDPERAAKAAYNRTYNALASAVAAGMSESDRVVEATKASDKARETAQRRLDEFNKNYRGRTADEVAIEAKRKQLMNNQLTAEALRAQEEVEKGIKYLRRVLDAKNVQRMGADIADQVAALLERFDLHRMTAAQAAERKKLVDWLAEQEEAGIVPDLSPEMKDAAYRKPYQQMTVSEFRDLVEAVKQLEYMGKEKDAVRLAEAKLKFGELRDKLVAQIKKHRGNKAALTPRTPTTKWGRIRKGARTYFAVHTKAATIFNIMDDGVDGGALWSYFMRPANEAGDMEAEMVAKTTERLAKILAPVKKLGDMESGAQEFPSIGRSLTRGERFVIALNFGNADNIDRVTVGENWTVEQLQPVLATLTSTEWKAVQEIWDLFEEFKPLVGAMERRLLGKEPNWVELQPFTITTADGKTITMKGGYYPIKYDPAASESETRQQNADQVKAMMRGAFTASTTKQSYTKDRSVKGKGTPILLTMSGVYGGFNEVIHDLAWREYLIHANKMLRDQSFSRAIGESFKDGVEIREQLSTWIQAIAVGQGEEQRSADRIAVFMRRSISAARLGFNTFSGAMQSTGYVNGAVRIGNKWMAVGMADFDKNPMKATAFVRDKSLFMTNRARTRFRDLNEIKNIVQDQDGLVRRGQASMFVIISTMQGMVDIPVWLGAYHKAMESGVSETTAIAMADQAVIDSQGSGMIKDLAAVERGNAWSKLFTVFYSFQNTQYQQMLRAARTKSPARAVADNAMLLIAPAVMKYALTQLLKPKSGEDDAEDEESFAMFVAKESAQSAMGTLIGIRELGGILDGRRYEGPSGVAMISDLFSAADQTKQAEIDYAMFKAYLNVAGDLFGVPSVQVTRTVDGFKYMFEKETIDPRAVLFGTRR
jgi:hypothetical protein